MTIEVTYWRFMNDKDKEAFEQKLQDFESDWIKMRDIAEKLEAENAKLRECVEFYALSKIYQGYSSNRTGEYEYYHGEIINDSGKCARQVLKELGDK